MPFVRIKGVAGLVFEPESLKKEKKKHNCTDCLECGWCSDSRCSLCVKASKSTYCKNKLKKTKY